MFCKYSTTHTTRVIASKISSNRLVKCASEEALISKKYSTKGTSYRYSSCSSLWIIKGSGIEPHYCKLSPFVNKPNTEQVWWRNQLRWPIGNTAPRELTRHRNSKVGRVECGKEGRVYKRVFWYILVSAIQRIYITKDLLKFCPNKLFDFITEIYWCRRYVYFLSNVNLATRLISWRDLELAQSSFPTISNRRIHWIWWQKHCSEEGFDPVEVQRTHHGVKCDNNHLSSLNVP